MKRVVLNSICAALLAGCGTEPSGTLTVSVDAIPSLVTDVDITVSGSVSRSPSSEAVMVIALAGAASTKTDTLPADGKFSLAVRLRANQENQLAITASDETGSVSDPTIVVVFHDDEGPQIAALTPPSRARNVALDSPIEALFAEALEAAGPSDGMALFHNANPVAGQSTLSADKRTLSFVPDAALEPGSVYEMRITGFADEAGNAAGTGQDLCFITSSDGFPADTANDESSDLALTAGTPAPGAVSPIDFRRIVFTRSGTRLYGLVGFNGNRTFVNDDPNIGTALIDIDIDQDKATGFKSVFDNLLGGPPGQPPLFESNLGAEMFIGLEPRVDFGDSAYVGILTSDTTSFNVVELFIPGICSSTFGFHVDAVLGTTADDGNFDFTVLAIATVGGAGFADAAPETTDFFTAQTAGGTPTNAAARSPSSFTGYVRRFVERIFAADKPFRAIR